MEDNKNLNENNELTDEQAEDVSGGIYLTEQEPGNCTRCGKRVRKSSLISGVCWDCRERLAREGRPVLL